MSEQEHVDTDNLIVTGAHRQLDRPSITVEGDVKIVVTQAFGPKGDNLVGISDVQFDGYPAITLGVRGAGREEQVHLSPIHGDSRKIGMDGLESGTACELFCPVSGEVLERVGEVEDGSGATYHAVYLSPKLSQGEIVMVSNIWGHYHSRIIDDMELISYWAATYGNDE